MSDLAAVWNRARRYPPDVNAPDIRGYREQIERALEYAGGSHTFDDVCDAVAERRLQFWPGHTSCVVTEILEYPQHRCLNFFLAAGNLAELQAMAPKLEEWGRSQGCTKAVLSGRRGWERSFLVNEGYEQKLVVLEKVL
jgi:hypothetical protein